MQREILLSSNENGLIKERGKGNEIGYFEMMTG
jgi:hypothetical protein